jgi:ADP-dependent phosphofructokinase/glucokinase
MREIDGNISIISGHQNLKQTYHKRKTSTRYKEMVIETICLD